MMIFLVKYSKSLTGKSITDTSDLNFLKELHKFTFSWEERIQESAQF